MKEKSVYFLQLKQLVSLILPVEFSVGKNLFKSDKERRIVYLSDGAVDMLGLFKIKYVAEFFFFGQPYYIFTA